MYRIKKKKTKKTLVLLGSRDSGRKRWIIYIIYVSLIYIYIIYIYIIYIYLGEFAFTHTITVTCN